MSNWHVEAEGIKKVFARKAWLSTRRERGQQGGALLRTVEKLGVDVAAVELALDIPAMVARSVDRRRGEAW